MMEMMTRAAVAVVLLLGGMGCQAPSAGPAPAGTARESEARRPAGVDGGEGRDQRSAAITSTDPCASRLHDLSGPLLLHLSLKGNLPADPQALRQLPGFADLPPLQCPVSGRAYIYNAQGLVIPDRAGGIVLYDAEPTHDGLRWGIFIAPGEGSQPMTAKVIAIPAEVLRR